jgi:hypothetical protein
MMGGVGMSLGSSVLGEICMNRAAFPHTRRVVVVWAVKDVAVFKSFEKWTSLTIQQQQKEVDDPAIPKVEFVLKGFVTQQPKAAGASPAVSLGAVTVDAAEKTDSTANANADSNTKKPQADSGWNQSLFASVQQQRPNLTVELMDAISGKNSPELPAGENCCVLACGPYSLMNDASQAANACDKYLKARGTSTPSLAPSRCHLHREVWEW